MNVFIQSKGNLKQGDCRVLIVRMTKDEAIKTIASLAMQIQSGNPNNHRYEQITSDGGFDFSIAVTEELSSGG